MSDLSDHLRDRAKFDAIDVVAGFLNVDSFDEVSSSFASISVVIMSDTS